MRIRLA